MPTRVAKTERLLKNASLVIAIGFGLVLAALFAIGVLAVRSEEADRLVTHTVEVQQAAESLLSELRDAESGQRGYVLTGRNEYFEPVARAEAKLPTLLASLKTLTMDNPGQQSRLERLAPLIDSRMDVIRRSVALAKQGDRDAATGLIASGEGRKLMDRIVTEMSIFFQTELDLLRSRQETSRQLRLWLTTADRARSARRDRACRRFWRWPRAVPSADCSTARGSSRPNPSFAKRRSRRCGRRRRWRPWDSSPAASRTTSTIC